MIDQPIWIDFSREEQWKVLVPNQKVSSYTALVLRIGTIAMNDFPGSSEYYIFTQGQRCNSDSMCFASNQGHIVSMSGSLCCEMWERVHSLLHSSLLISSQLPDFFPQELRPEKWFRGSISSGFDYLYLRWSAERFKVPTVADFQALRTNQGTQDIYRVRLPPRPPKSE